MNSIWQRFLAAVKFVVLGLIFIHVILFIVWNHAAVVDTGVSLIYRSYDRPNFLFVMLITSVVSIFSWWLFWVSVKTLRQIRESKSQSRIAKLEREMADRQSKAAMLQTKPTPPDTSKMD